MMDLSDQIIDCKCNGVNPNCSICDGKGYYYKPFNDEKKKIASTEADGHVLDFDALGIPKNVNINIPDYQPNLPRRKRNKKRRLPEASIPDASIFEKPKRTEVKNKDGELSKPKDNYLGKSPGDLVRSFPELQEFFKCNELNHANLERLLVDLSSIYKDKETHSAATTFIKFEMMKLKLEEEKSRLEPGRKIQKKKSRKNNNPDILVDFDIPYEISDISRMLNIPERSLIKILEQKSIYKKDGGILSEFEMKVIKPFISSRLKALKRQHKRRLW